MGLPSLTSCFGAVRTTESPSPFRSDATYERRPPGDQRFALPFSRAQTTKVDAKTRQLENLQAENKEIFAQFQAQTIRGRTAMEALELLQANQRNGCHLNACVRSTLEALNCCTAKKLTSTSRRDAVTKSMEWIVHEIERTQIQEERSTCDSDGLGDCPPRARRRNRELVAEICHFAVKRPQGACDISLDSVRGCLQALADQALLKMTSESDIVLQNLVHQYCLPLILSQLEREREAFIAQYSINVNAAVDKRVDIYRQALRLKLISVEGDGARLQNEVDVVNHVIETVRAQADLTEQQREAQEAYFSADIRLLGEQWEVLIARNF
ncbi:hypothetical protein C8R46DRAFT_1029366 [Mycena filopes]|nr:hypothetical protein C8R46DRAFT_1029366 [Mycena filopes]